MNDFAHYSQQEINETTNKDKRRSRTVRIKQEKSTPMGEVADERRLSRNLSFKSFKSVFGGAPRRNSAASLGLSDNKPKLKRKKSLAKIKRSFSMGNSLTASPQ